MINRIYKFIIMCCIVISGTVFPNIAAVAKDSEEQWITIAFDTKKDASEEDRIYVKIHPGETVQFPEVPEEADGMSFMGWYATYENLHQELVNETTIFNEPALVKPSYAYVLSPSDAELIFRKTDYTVTLEAGVDIDRDKIIYVDFDETTDLYTLLDQYGWGEPEREGYTFLGWYTEPEGGTLIEPGIYVTSDMTIYAHWKFNDGIYRLVYYTNYNNSAVGLYKIQWCKKIPKLPKLKRAGYIFKGWYYSHYDDHPDLMVKKGDELKYSSYIFAQWEKIDVKKASIKKLKLFAKNKLQLSIKKVKKADGYQIMCSKNNKFKKKKSKTYISKKATKTIKIKKNMKYIKVRAYRIDSTGKKVYGKWSKVKMIKKK